MECFPFPDVPVPYREEFKPLFSLQRLSTDSYRLEDVDGASASEEFRLLAADPLRVINFIECWTLNNSNA